MESLDSPWGDIVRTVTSWQACSSCSWDTSTSTLPAVGEATSIIYREEGKQGRETKRAKWGVGRWVRMDSTGILTAFSQAPLLVLLSTWLQSTSISVLRGLPIPTLLMDLLYGAQRPGLYISARPER